MTTNYNKNIGTPSKIERWEDIEKQKWDNLLKKREVKQKIGRATGNFQHSTAINILKAINKRSIGNFQNNPFQPSIHDNLMSLVSSIDLLRLSYNKLKKNKGALTPGVIRDSTADGISEEKFIQLSKDIKSGNFKWLPVRRIYVEKPGKTTLRPIGIPDFQNRLVQNNIRMILEAIYEPEFTHIGINTGFRLNVGCNNAIEAISHTGEGSTYAIEGDIKGAYDNVNHEILIKILRRRIQDDKFLQLLYSGFKAGLIQDFQYFDTFLGVPQGGIASPILFNIYMNEFDIYAQTELNEYVMDLNKKNQNKTVITSEYYKLDSRTDRLIKRIRALKTQKPEEFIDAKGIDKKVETKRLIEIIKEIDKPFYEIKLKKEAEELITTTLSYEEQLVFTDYNNNKTSKNVQTKKISEYSVTEQPMISKRNRHNNIKRDMRKKILDHLKINNLFTIAHKAYGKILESEFQKTRKEKLQTTYTDVNKQIITYTVYRYADDWVLLIKAPEEVVIEIKERIKEWFITHLKLELALEKTLITKLNENKAHFLGFEIFYQINKKIVKGKDERFINVEGEATQKYPGKIQIMPDTNRLKNRFILKGLLDLQDKPREIGFLVVLEDHQIVEKYNQMMVGLGNYYIINISRKSALNYWHYILYFSCLKTLATKHKTTVKNIVNTYGHLDLSNPKVNPAYDNQKVTNKRIVITYKIEKDNRIETKYMTLLNYDEFMSKILKLRNSQRDILSLQPTTIDFDVFQKVNWRTNFQTQGLCSICGSPEAIESHHIRPLHHHGGKFTGFRGFDKLVASLGRKQIPVCKNCHQNITYGRYDGMSLNELYDVRLVAPEGLIKLNKYFDQSFEEPKKKIKKIIEIDPINKTYYSEELHAYYQNKNKSIRESFEVEEFENENEFLWNPNHSDTNGT